jgi:Zn-dependent protease with chaperone function
MSLWAGPLLIVVLLGVALVAGRPATTTAAPRLGAAVELLALAAIGLMPPLLLACAAASWSSSSGSGGHTFAGVCIIAAGPIGWGQLALYAVATGLVGRLAVLAGSAVRAARRTELAGAALLAATLRHLPDGTTAWVVPSERPAAYCAGIRHPRAMVTTGLLQRLDPAEQEAVLRHETAHLRLGHPRLLLFGAVVERSYRWLPPARLAWRRLRRELEAAADDAVVAAVGEGPLLRALAKVALAAGPRSAATFADPEDLRYRIRRLQGSPRRPARASVALGLVGAALTATLAAATCEALHADVAWASVVPCIVGFGYLGWRPTWAAFPAGWRPGH